MNKRILSAMLAISLIAASGVPQYAWAEENVGAVSESESFYDEQQDENTVESDFKSDVEETEFENLNNMQETSETDDVLEDASQMESSTETSEIDIQNVNVASDFSYIILDDGTVGITGYTGSNRRNLVIPEEIDDKKVTKIMDNAFHLERDCFAGSLTIPEGITYIGKYAFAFNVFSGNLYIPNTVIEIGEGAFYDDLFSGDLIIPDSVEIIGDLAFAGTYFDGKLKLSKNLKTIGKSAFSGNLKGDLNIPDGVVSIGEEAFAYTNFDGDITIPDSVKVIGKKAFFDAHVTSTFGNIIINHMPDNIDNEAFISGYKRQDVNMSIGSELGVGQTRIGKITAMCMRFAYPLAINWKSSNPSIAKVNEKGEITAISEGSVVITAELYNGISVSGDLEVVGYAVDTKEDNYNICIGPEMSKLANLWTGDEVTIGWNAYEGRNKDISTVEILSGEKLITVKALESEYGYWSVSCNSAGTAKLRIKFKSDIHEPVDITLKIKEKTAKDDVKYNPSMKIGEMGYNVQCLNVSYGKDPTICLSPKDKEKMYIEFENLQGEIPSYKRVVDGKLIKFPKPTDEYLWYDNVLFPLTSGKIELLYYQDHYDYGKKDPVSIFTVNIEEPVISNNIKNEYKINEQQILYQHWII